MNENGQRWTNVDAGPIQVKRVNEAIRKLSWEAKTFVQVTGVVGGEERRSVVTAMVLTGEDKGREDVRELGREIAERFDYQVTKANAKEIVKAFEEAVAQAAETRPERDERISPEKNREQREAVAERNREYEERSRREAVLREQIRAKAPTGAVAVIVAELQEDKSDLLTDYFANSTTRAVAIGFRFSKREDFRALRRAAASFPETAHLGPDADKDIEHRDNYSMGRGNYLSDHGWDGSGSGWAVRSYELAGDWWHVDEDATQAAR